ncbi:hypothetical protein ABPG77_002882 [Micractinium sp. CCAP 211/92]
MGQSMSFGLTQFDVDELIAFSKGAFTQQEIEALYKRFRSLDRGRKGFITADEFLSIPELSINPLAKRLAYLFESINFREFVGLLAPFSRAASRDDKLRAMFSVYDVDGDGAISEEDMEIVLRQLAGSSLSDDELKSIIAKVMRSAGVGERGLTFPEYKAALEGLEVDLHVEVPLEH